MWALAEGARCRALLLAARGDLPAAHEATERRARRSTLASTLPFERGRALLVQGQIARRRKQKRAARESLEAALALFETLGAREWAERAREDIARLGRRQQTDLTASEGRVAKLVAQGLSNKEVAAALFVTVHTVEVAPLAHVREARDPLAHAARRPPRRRQSVRVSAISVGVAPA